MIVLDSSAAIAMVSGSSEGSGFRSLLLKGEKVIAPELFRYELLNVVRKYVAGQFVTQEVGMSWYQAGIQLVDEFYTLEGMGAEVLAESLSIDHPSYDVSYLVLARRHAATLFTLDKRLIQACAQRCVNCTEAVGC